jgi:multicomponent Na+:H+ antiporter subunit E
MKRKKRNGAILLLALLTIFWMVIASSINLVELIIGFLASTLIVLYSYDMIFTSDDATSFTPKTIVALVVLFYILVKEIIFANFEVAKIVLSPKMPINPGFKKIRQPLKKDLNQALFGNAITLTPGTLTIDMNDEEIIVHGLRLDNIDKIEGSALQKAFIRLEEASK